MDAPAEAPQPRIEAKQAVPPPSGVMRYLHDARHQVFGVDNAARKALGITATGEEPIQTDLKSTVGPERWEGLETHFKQLSREKPSATSLIQVGDEKWIQVTTTADYKADGSCVYDTTEVDVSETVRDVNAKAQVKIDTAVQNEKKAENTARTLAHDIRMRTATIVGNAQLLLSPELTISEETRVTLLKAIQQNGEGIGTMAKEYIELMRLEINGEAIQKEPVSMAAIIQDLKQQYEPVVRQKPGIVISIPDDMPNPMGQEYMVRQVLDNLISNAIKYGGDNPRVEIRGVRMSNGRIRYSVKDYGLGIPEDKKARLFTEFGRLQLPEHHGVPGIGLGLTIVKKMVELQGGEVGVESEVGKGSTFFFILDSAPQEQAQTDQ